LENNFTIEAQEGLSRAGKFSTAHGTFETPQFMPVGTLATVKGVDVERLEELGAQITLVNTYHLWQRPGHQRVKDLGGVHSFCSWNKPILSDSGGFQVFSLQSIREVTEQGVAFRSHLDGKKLFLSPEVAIEIQEALGVDIAMVLDECPAPGRSDSDLEQSLLMTIRWAGRCLAARQSSNTNIFGITQGGCSRELRTLAAQKLAELPLDGYAIGGLSVGEPKDKMYEVLSYHPAQLPEEKIRYLMGVGTPADIVEAVRCGVDLFDCVMPTRSGRFGRAFVGGDEPYINIKNVRFQEDLEPLDSACSCVACRRYSRAYIHHLFRADEMLGPQLLSIHNLAHYLKLMRDVRDSIKSATFGQLHSAQMARWQGVKLGQGA